MGYMVVDGIISELWVNGEETVFTRSMFSLIDDYADETMSPPAYTPLSYSLGEIDEDIWLRYGGIVPKAWSNGHYE